MVEDNSAAYVGKRFCSYDDVERWLEKHEDRVGHEYSRQNSKTVQRSRVKDLPERLKFYEVQLGCVRRGVHTSKGQGIRTRKSKKTGCTAKIVMRVKKKKYLQIMEIDEHHNHEASPNQNRPPLVDEIENANEPSQKKVLRPSIDNINRQPILNAAKVATSISKANINPVRKTIVPSHDNSSDDASDDGSSSSDEHNNTSADSDCSNSRRSSPTDKFSLARSPLPPSTESPSNLLQQNPLVNEEEDSRKVLQNMFEGTYAANCTIEIDNGCKLLLNHLPDLLEESPAGEKLLDLQTVDQWELEINNRNVNNNFNLGQVEKVTDVAINGEGNECETNKLASDKIDHPIPKQRAQYGTARITDSDSVKNILGSSTCGEKTPATEKHVSGTEISLESETGPIEPLRRHVPSSDSSSEQQQETDSATTGNLSSVLVKPSGGRGRPPKPRPRAIGLPRDEPTTLKFSEKSPRRQTETMLNWLLPQKIAKMVLETDYKVQMTDLKLKDDCISESFMHESVEIDLLKPFFNRNVFNRLREAIKKKIEKDLWTCGTCKVELIGQSILCESCLLWHHFQCVFLKRKPAAKTIWFCPGCKK